MSTAAATVVENPVKAGESVAEKPRGEVQSKIESGDVSGVYRIAQTEVDEELARGLGLSKIDDPNAGTIAGPEIIALKQADAEFENKAKTALGGLKTSIDLVGKPSIGEVAKSSDFESTRIAREDTESKRVYPDAQSDPAVQMVERYVSGKVDRRVTGWINFEKTSNKNNPSVAEVAKQKEKEIESATSEAWIDFQRSFPEKAEAYKDKIPQLGKFLTDAQAEEGARLTAVAEKAMAEGPLTEKELVNEINAFKEEKAKPLEMPTAMPLTEIQKPVVEQPDEPVVTIEALTPKEQEEVKEVVALAELDEDIDRGVQAFEEPLQKIDAELSAEKKALEEFNGTHGKAHTPLEQAYLDALSGRISALEFEKTAHETSDESFEAKAKQAELKQKADKAEAAYQAMYDSYLNQSVDAPKVLHLDDEDLDFEARQYEQFHPGQTFGGERSVAPRTQPSFEPSPMGKAPKPKGAMGKFIDSLKFWKFFGRKQP